MASLELAGSLQGHIPLAVGYKSVSWLVVAFPAGYHSSLSLQSQWQLAGFVHWADPQSYPLLSASSHSCLPLSQALIQDTGRLFG